jgi:hypothetical protein
VKEAYKHTPIATMHSRLSDPNFIANGNPVKMVKLMITCIDRRPVPQRLVLGPEPYAILQQALSERLAVVEAQKDVSRSTDFLTNRHLLH